MSIEEKNFGCLSNGQPIKKFTLKNRNGMSAEILTYGCRIAKLWVPDRNGRTGNVVIGHDTLAEYEASGDVFGSVVGRFANRIHRAQFSIGNNVFHLAKNEGENSLHSAPGGFQNRIWRIKCCNNNDDAPSVTFSYHSPDGECGFPGNIDVEVTDTLTTDNALILDYCAKTDHITPLNLTNHTFFNLTGDPAKNILSHELQISANKITETDSALIPTGKLLQVEGTPFDFRRPKIIGQDIRSQEPTIKARGGFDHNFVLASPTGVQKAAELFDAASGRRMLVFTDLPGVQIYTANSYPDGWKACGGVMLRKHNAVCLETQYFPDSVNHPEFPFSYCTPESPYHKTTIYKFVIAPEE
jgi:aldose 1-epimerase